MNDFLENDIQDIRREFETQLGKYRINNQILGLITIVSTAAAIYVLFTSKNQRMLGISNGVMALAGFIWAARAQRYRAMKVLFRNPTIKTMTAVTVDLRPSNAPKRQTEFIPIYLITQELDRYWLPCRNGVENRPVVKPSVPTYYIGQRGSDLVILDSKSVLRFANSMEHPVPWWNMNARDAKRRCERFGTGPGVEVFRKYFNQ